jgi:molecular chaperone GrpE (heat shock protein)
LGKVLKFYERFGKVDTINADKIDQNTLAIEIHRVLDEFVEERERKRVEEIERKIAEETARRQQEQQAELERERKRMEEEQAEIAKVGNTGFLATLLVCILIAVCLSVWKQNVWLKKN